MQNPRHQVLIAPIRSFLQAVSQHSQSIKSTKINEPNLTFDEITNGCILGIDTHADSSCAGKHFRILEFVSGKSFTVKPFLDTYEAKTDISLVNGVVAADTADGNGYILELNNFLDFTDTMNDSILVPMQARQNGIVVDDVPKEMCHYGVSTQSIFIPQQNFSLPIEYKGPIPFIRIRYPTDSDLENYPWIQVTSPSEWIPYQESSINSISSPEPSCLQSDDQIRVQFYDNIVKSVVISQVESRKKKTSLSPEELAKLWKIPLQNAKRTLNATTNNYIRTNEGKLSRRFRTDLFQKRYRRMGGWFSRFYTDTLFFKTKTLDLFTCAQVYGNRAKFCKLYPMVAKSDAHETLSTLVHEIGIPSEIHSDGAKEVALGKYRKMMTKYQIFHSMSEPYSPWENYAEDCIRILKNSA